MIHKAIRTISRTVFTRNIFQLKNDEKPSLQGEDALIKRKQSVELMEDNFQKVKMDGLAERDITGIDNFQKDILAQNKFDLMNPKIRPKIASMSTTMGLQLTENNQLAEVNLGKIKVKKENEVFLSQVDPNNIPEYYDVIFDYQKQMSLVGKKMESPEGNQEGQVDTEMKISARRAFEEKTQKELSRQILGMSVDIYSNPRLAWKQIMLALFVSCLFSFPLLQTVVELDQCLDSIREIQEERMSQLQKIKRQALGKAILNNPEMRII